MIPGNGHCRSTMISSRAVGSGARQGPHCSAGQLAPIGDAERFGMIKVGDTKDCRNCLTKGAAVYTRTTIDAAFVVPGGAHPERIPEQFAWICSACGDEERVPSRGMM